MGLLVGNVDRFGEWFNSNSGVWAEVDVDFGAISAIDVGVGVGSGVVTPAYDIDLQVGSDRYCLRS